MKHATWFGLVAVIIVGLALAGALSTGAPLAAPAGGATPTRGVYFPVVLKLATSTLTPTRTPTITPPPTSTSTQPPPNVQIVFVERGAGSSLDEYVEIQNLGGLATMTSWTLEDAANHVYTFPAFTLGTSAAVKVWTKCGTNTATDLYQCSSAPIWNNDGDTATLKNQSAVVVDVYSY